MDLKTYTGNLPGGGVGSLAVRIGVSRTYLSQLSGKQRTANDKIREPSPELCVRIEVATYGQVPRWETRPTDWHLIWPELIGREGAPVPGEAPRATEVERG